MADSNLRRHQAINVTLSFSLLFSSASFLSLNIFTVPIEQQVPSLTSVWSRALGFGSIVFSLATLLTLPLLNTHKPQLSTSSTYHEPHPLTRRVRLASPIVAISYLPMCLCGVPAIYHANKSLLYMAVIPQAIPYAFFYLFSIQALLAWMPLRPALAMTFVSASYGASQFFISPSMFTAIRFLGLKYSLVITSISFFVLVSVCGSLLRFPTQSETNRLKAISPGEQQQQQHIENEVFERDEDIHESIKWYKLMSMPSFYSYLAIVFLGRAAMALFPFFFKLAYVFHIPTPISVLAFQLLSIAGVVWAITMNSIYETISKTNNTSSLSSIRPLLLIIFLLQSCLFLLLIPLSHPRYALPAIIVISLLVVILESQTAFSVILASFMFGSRNGVNAYGLAAALGIGPAEAFFTTLMSIIDVRCSINGISTPATFTMFYYFASLCLVMGGVLVMFQGKCQKLFYHNLDP